MSRSGRRPGRPGRRPWGRARGRRQNAGPQVEDVQRQLLLAHRLSVAGAYVPALEAAGEAVRLDPRRPEAYLVIGDVHLAAGALKEALQAFERAERKAGRAARDGGELDALLEARASIAKCHLLGGALEQAVGALKKVLGTAPGDPLRVRQPLAETLLQLGQAEACLASLPEGETAAPDTHLVAAFALLELGRRGDATERARQAYLGNVYLPAALRGAPMPDPDIAHGTWEASPGAAQDVVDRLAPWTQARPERLDTVLRIATTTLVRREIEDLTDLARALNREDDPGARAALTRRIEDLRRPERIRGDTVRVLAALAEEDVS